jgi:hypothetical protein
MKNLQIVVEGSSEEAFVNDVLVKHFAALNIFISARKIKTGWDRLNNKPAKGGLLKYSLFKKDVLRWIESDNGRPNTFYSSFIDLYAFPTDSESPYTREIQNIINPYLKISALESAIGLDINHLTFIPYVQLHEFEALILVEPDRLLTMYPGDKKGIQELKRNIHGINPEEINELPQSSPSKRIIMYLPNYKVQKAQVGPLVAEDIGLNLLREKCPHFNEWITKLENI